MLRNALAAVLALVFSFAAHGTAWRYSWYSHTGPYFNTPEEVCIWSRPLYPNDRGSTMAMGADGYCRDYYGQGYGYIIPYQTPIPYQIALQGRSSTKALPAGPVLPMTARVTQNGALVGGVSITVKMQGIEIPGTTDETGVFKFNYVPPFQKAAVDQIVAACWYCENEAQKVVVVDPVVESCPAVGNPVAPATGAKVQRENDWTDLAPHALDVVRSYSSLSADNMGLSPRWAHNWAATLQKAELDASVSVGGSGQAMFTRETAASPWKATHGSDQLVESADGTRYIRSADESSWHIDTNGKLQSITAQNGWRHTLAYDGAGHVIRITNNFGRQLVFAYNAQGLLASVVLPGGGALNYSYDAAARLAGVIYPDGTGRRYYYTNVLFPFALTGIDDESGVRFATFSYDEFGRAVSTRHVGGVYAYTVNYGQSAGNGSGSIGSAGSVDPSLYRSNAQVTNALGGVQSYEWIGGNGELRLLSAGTQVDGASFASRVMGAAGLPLSEIDFLGHITSYQWDTQRQLLIATTSAADRPEAQTSRTRWLANFRLPEVVEEGVNTSGTPSRTTAYTYDSAGNKLSEAVTDVATDQVRRTAWTYNAQGLPDTLTDAKGGLWRYTYDASGNRASAKNPVGQTTSYTYDLAGRIASQTEPAGLVTRYTYDARGRVLTQAQGNETTRYTYTPTGQLASATLPSGQSASYSYDAAQRLIAASDNRGNTVQYTLDAAGNRTREEVKDATGQIARLTSRVINSLNQVSAVRGASGQTTQLDYDANGEPIAQTDPLNQSTRQSLDALRRPVATTFADNAAAAQAYNALDQLTQATDPKGVATSYTYNAFGDVMSETSPDIGTVGYERDALGDITKRTDAKGNVTTITRDGLGRPITTQYGANNTVHYSYDTAGYISRIEDKSGTTSYERDLLGRILSKTQAVNDNPGAPTPYKTSYSYLSGELATITYPSGLVVTYKRSASGQIAGIDTQEPGGTPKKPKPSMAFVANLTHTALGQPKAWTWSNGDAAARSFDADGRMTANEFAGYTFDAASRITGITQSLYAQGTGTVYLTPLSWTAGYDRRNRLTSFGRAGSESNYTYDANSNRLTAVDKTTSDTDLDGEFDEADFTRTTAQVSAQDNASNKLQGFSQTLTRAKAGLTKSVVTTPVTYSLDANGALASDGLRSFEYDESDRLATVKLSKDGEAAKVTYLTNGLGQRVFKSEPQTDKVLPSEAELGVDFVTWLKKQFGWLFTKAQGTASIGTAFTYADGALPSWAVLGEYDNGSAAGKGRTEYIWLPTEDGQAIPVGIFRNGEFFAIHSDHLGTPRLMTNEAKQVVWQWPYSAFGSNKPTGVLKATDKPKQALTNQPVLLKATAATELNLRFPGQMEDVEAGSFYNYFRQYDPRTGRYTQGDPVGLGGGWNRHSYVDGNLLNDLDPFGLQSGAQRKNFKPLETLPLEGGYGNGVGGGGSGFGGGGGGGGGGYSSNAARRDVMRDAGIPTSQQPISQTRNASGREYSYESPAPGGGTQRMSVQNQTMDRSHPGQSHWEAGRVKMTSDGVRYNSYGCPRLENGKSKVDY